jgi:hypothetical protein
MNQRATPVEPSSPEQELQHHTYRSSDIPWWVRMIWLFFWVFAVYYSVKYVLPAIQSESFFQK